MSTQANILVVDDEEVMRDSCRQALHRAGHRVKVAADGLEAMNTLKKESFDLIILDLKMPGLNGLDVLQKVKEDDPEAIVIVITGYATVESAVEAMKRGAYDYLSKPFTPAHLRLVTGKALEKKKLVLENVLLKTNLKDTLGDGVIIGRSDSMRHVEKLIQKVGPTDSTVLIQGESGTGKELVARAIHDNSPRKDMPFVVVDCGNLVESLFESELFGHVRGSFTGATQTKYGRFELANGGTLFLDEIGNITPNIQAKLLRVIQEREVTKVGSSKTIKVDVRLVAATNMDLQQAVRDGAFREDLFYRLSVVPIILPSLRDRKDDIPLLAEYFLNKHTRKRKKTVKGISSRALEALMKYDWPGNVRELENAVERAVVLTDGNIIEPPDLLYYGLAAVEKAPSFHPAHGPDDAVRLESLEDMEKKHVTAILAACDGHRGKAAEALGIDRKTLRLKMRKYGLE